MKLTLKELNTLYYSLNVAITHHSEHKLLDVDSLNEMGFQIARRTVAKYREEQGIPSSHLRRSY